MVQRKGDLPVVESRRSEERGKEELDGMPPASMARGPWSLQAWRSSSLRGCGSWGGEPELVSPSLTCQGTTFSGGPAPTGERQYPLRRFPVRVGPEGQTLNIIGHILRFLHWIG